MRKIITLIMVLTILLCACESKPDGMSDKVYELGCKALDVIEKYEDCDIDKSTALDRLDQISDSLSNETEITMAAKVDYISYCITGNMDMTSSVDELKKMLNK